MTTTRKPVPTDVVVLKFFNGFMNGYIFNRNWTSNIEDKDAEAFDLDFLVSVWKFGTSIGILCRHGRDN